MVQNVFFQETLTQGTAVIALDHGGYRGRCYYSAKIPHGLGEGDVHLSFALIDPDGYEEGPVEGEQLSHLVKSMVQITGAAYVGEPEFLLHGRRPSQGAHNPTFLPIQEGHAWGAKIAGNLSHLLPCVAGVNQSFASEHTSPVGGLFFQCTRGTILSKS